MACDQNLLLESHSDPQIGWENVSEHLQGTDLQLVQQSFRQVAVLNNLKYVSL